MSTARGNILQHKTLVKIHLEILQVVSTIKNVANKVKFLQNTDFNFKSEVNLMLLMHINHISEHDSCSILINVIKNSAQEAGTANKTY